MDAEVRHRGKEGGDGAEGCKAVTKLDRQLADCGAIDFPQVHREVAREEEEVTEGLQTEPLGFTGHAEGANEGEVGHG